MQTGRTALLFVALAACAPAAVTEAAPDGPKLEFPVACQVGRTCELQNYVDRDPGPQARDYRCGPRTYDAHSGVDIRLPDMAAQRAGVAVLAAAPGRVARVRDGVPDVSVRERGAAAVSGQECGNGVVVDHGNGWETQYCHLAKGSVQVKPGDAVSAGTPLARIGLSGQTEYPHLHFTVRKHGKVVDPFAPDMSDPQACGPQSTLWSRAAEAQTAYVSTSVLNVGFANKAVTMEDIEAGDLASPGRTAPVLAVYGRAIGVRGGDVLELELTGPDGARLAHNQAPAPRDQAQRYLMVGKKRPGEAWPAGRYALRFRVLRNGQPVAERSLTATL